jgi:hypothetical protein
LILSSLSSHPDSLWSEIVAQLEEIFECWTILPKDETELVAAAAVEVERGIGLVEIFFLNL